MNVNGNNGYSIKEAIKLLGITQHQAEQLDELDGKDDTIGVSIFNKAQAIRNNADKLMLNDPLTEKIRTILKDIKIPFLDTTNKEYLEMQFEADMKKVISERIKFLKSHKSLVDRYEQECSTLGNKGPAFCALRDAARDKDDSLLPERYLPRNGNSLAMELNLLECGVFSESYLPQSIRDKYGDNLDSLLDKFNQKGNAVYEKKYIPELNE